MKVDSHGTSVSLTGVSIERVDGFGYQDSTEFAENVLRELNLKSFAQVEPSHCRSNRHIPMHLIEENMANQLYA